MKILKKTFPGIVLPLLFAFNCTGNLLAQKIDPLLSDAEKKQVVSKVLMLLKDNYIFAEKVPAIDKAINKKLTEGGYTTFSTVSQFLKNLNTDLETLTSDRHVNVFYDPIRIKQIEAEAKGGAGTPSDDPQFIKRARYENYMVRKAERLEGNVGYLKLDLFVDVRLSKSTLVAAMNFLINSDALIIDLRQNGGGYANTVNFLTSYFLPDSTLISQSINRPTKTTTRTYTEHDDMVQKYSNQIPLYILVSKRTSSAAEAFAYQLQALKRAAVIGDTTNGEANPGYALVVNSDMWLMVPTFISTNAVTKTNWQGIGVVPDVQIQSDKAFLAAQAIAYKQLAAASGNARTTSVYEWLTLSFEAKAYPVDVNEKTLQTFQGEYADNRKITYHQQNLYYQRTGEKKKLVPLNQNTFELEGSPFFRVKFSKDESGKVTALEGIYDDGQKEVSKKLD